MQVYKHPNSEKIKIGTVDITSGHLTFFDPNLQSHFPNSLNRILDNGTFETFLYKFKEPSKDNGILAIEVVFENNEPVKWQNAVYVDDPNSDFHYTNSCGLIADTSVFDTQTIDNLKNSIDKAIGMRSESGLNYRQLKFNGDNNCIYFESGIGWYDISVDLKWGFCSEGKLCRLFIDFYSHLL